MVDFSIFQTVLVVVTPELAAEWLSRNTHNRPIRQPHVQELAWDMRVGRWRGRSHQGIGFDNHGRLIDGQHRLLAVIEAGVAVEMLVTTCVPADTVGVIDIQAKRSLSDAMQLSGRGELTKGTSARNTNAGMWRAMMGGLQYGLKGRYTYEQIFQFADANSSAGTFALTEFGKYPRISMIHVAPAMAAVARAYHHYRNDRSRLQQFVQLFCTGIGSGAFAHEETVLRFRNILLARGGRNSNSAGEIYGKTAVAIKAYIERRSLSKFYEPSEEPFPLPGDTVSSDSRRSDRVARHAGQLGAGGQGAHPMAAGAARQLLS